MMTLVAHRPFAGRYLSSRLRVLLRLVAPVVLALVLAGLPRVALADEARYLEGLAAYQTRQYPQAYQIWLEIGDSWPAAQHGLGLLHERGLGVPMDPPAAVEWYRKAAAAGHAAAQFNLGRLYALGQGVVRDLTQAASWWLRAADQGNPHAMHNLALMFYAGEGVPQSFEQAATWLRRAAAQDFAESEYFLGEMLRLGRVRKLEGEDPEEILIRAAAHGSAKARAVLHALAEAGGISRERVEALIRTQSQSGADSQDTPTSPAEETEARAKDDGWTRRPAAPPREAVVEPKPRAEPEPLPDAARLVTWRAWLASFSSASAALREWRYLREDMADLVENLEPDFQTIRIGDPSYISHRLRVGPMESRESAQDFCTRVRTHRKDAFCVAVSD